MRPKVIITGILGQDGTTMAEYLLQTTEVEVIGMTRRTSTPNWTNFNSIHASKDQRERLKVVQGDLTDQTSLNSLVTRIRPDYFINFGANSFVGCSWEMPYQVFDVNAGGVLRALEAIRMHDPQCRFYSAGSSEEFGDVIYTPQDINHPIRPRSPYGASKAAARHLVKVYRDSYHLYAVHGILFNHEGTRRSEEFVTRKITKGVARIFAALEKGEPFEPIELGNLDTYRDWSDAEDFVDGVWRMLNQDKFYGSSKKGGLMIPFNSGMAKEYVLASGEDHSIREFVEEAFRVAGIDIELVQSPLEPKEMNQRYVLRGTESCVVRINPKFYRPAEVNHLRGNAEPAKEDLGWTPKTNFHQLVRKMVKHDIHLALST